MDNKVFTPAEIIQWASELIDIQVGDATEESEG